MYWHGKASRAWTEEAKVLASAMNRLSGAATMHHTRGSRIYEQPARKQINTPRQKRTTSLVVPTVVNGGWKVLSG